MEYTWYGEGAFSERGMVENAMYRSEGAPVLTMYLYELPLWIGQLLINILMSVIFRMHVHDNQQLEKVFQIWNIIHNNKIHVLGEWAFSEWGMFENAICGSVM